MRVEVGEAGWCLGHTRNCKKKSLLCLHGLATSPPFTVALKHSKGRSWGRIYQSIFIMQEWRPNIGTSDFFTKSNMKYGCAWNLLIFIYWFNFLFLFLLCSVQTKWLQPVGWFWPKDHHFIQAVIFSPEVGTTIWSSQWPGDVRVGLAVGVQEKKLTQGEFSWKQDAKKKGNSLLQAEPCFSGGR